MYGSKNRAFIELEVKPTTFPEGVYNVRTVEKKGNPYSDFVSEDPKLQAMLDRVKRANENSKTMASIAINVAPYIITPMLGLEGIKGFSGFIVREGIDAAISKGMENILTNNNVEKHTVNPVINE